MIPNGRRHEVSSLILLHQRRDGTWKRLKRVLRLVEALDKYYLIDIAKYNIYCLLLDLVFFKLPIQRRWPNI
jgi:hypothetical protein